MEDFFSSCLTKESITQFYNTQFGKKQHTKELTTYKQKNKPSQSKLCPGMGSFNFKIKGKHIGALITLFPSVILLEICKYLLLLFRIYCG